MDRIKEMLDKLTELTDEQLVELQNEIVSEFESVEGEAPTPQTVDAMTSLADMLDSVRSEATRREAEVKELANRAAEAAARVRGNADDTEQAASDSEAAPDEKPEEKAEEKEEEKAMDQASTVTDTASELSTEQTEQVSSSEASPETAAPAAAEAAEMPADAPAAPAVEEEKAEEEAPAEEVPAAEEPTEEKPAEAQVQETAAELASETAEAVAEPAKEAEASTTNETAATAAVEIQEATPVTAAANESLETVEVQAPADRRPAVESAAAPVAITAGADIPGYTAGSSMKDMNDVAEAFVKRLHGLRRVNGGDGEQHIVASLSVSYPEERTLNQDPEANWAKVQAVAGPEAIVASGGHAAPFEVRYDIFGFGTTDRPVRDSLPKFQADRGGIRFITPPTLSGAANAVGTWTNTVDTTPAGATKNSLTVAAAAENTVATDAITLQMQFGNLMSRAYPELVARHNELGLIQHARHSEQYLLTAIDAASTAVTTTNLIGVARDFLVQIGRAAAAYRARHRLASDAPLRAIAPAWVRDAMIADLALSMPGGPVNTLSVSYGEVEGYLRDRGVNITFTADSGLTGAQSAGAMLEFPDTFVWRLFAEGTFLFLDGGTLDLGIIRDSTLVGTNDYKMFVETFEGLAKVGIEGLSITSTIQINGAAAALRDTLGGVAASTIEL